MQMSISLKILAKTLGIINYFSYLCIQLKNTNPYMKITKVNTIVGELKSPVSTELSVVVERMQAPKTKEAANRIASIALQSRLMIESGGPRYYLKDTDLLPYLIFSATFGKGGYEHPSSFSQLLLLNIPCPQGIQQVAEIPVGCACIACVTTYLLCVHLEQPLVHLDAVLKPRTLTEGIEGELLDEGDAVNKDVVALGAKLHVLHLLATHDGSHVWL